MQLTQIIQPTQLRQLCNCATYANHQLVQILQLMFTHTAHTTLLGKNLKKWKMRKTSILWYLCQNSFKCEFNTPHIVKFDSGLILFSSFFSFQLTFMTKKSFCVFWQFCQKKVVKNKVISTSPLIGQSYFWGNKIFSFVYRP